MFPFVRPRALALLFAVIMLGAVLTGCGPAAPTPAPTSVATPTPANILETAAKRLADTPAAGFTLAIDGDTWIDPAHTIRLVSAEGDLVRPGNVRTSFKVEVAGQIASMSLITVGNKTWVSNIVTGKWEPAPVEFAYQPSILFDDHKGIGPVMSQLTNLTMLPSELINGKDAWHVQGIGSGDVIGMLSFYTIRGNPITVDLWIEKATDNLLRARIAEPPGSDRPHPAVWTLDLVRHGEQLTIDPPSE